MPHASGVFPPHSGAGPPRFETPCTGSDRRRSGGTPAVPPAAAIRQASQQLLGRWPVAPSPSPASPRQTIGQVLAPSSLLGPPPGRVQFGPSRPILSVLVRNDRSDQNGPPSAATRQRPAVSSRQGSASAGPISPLNSARGSDKMTPHTLTPSPLSRGPLSSAGKRNGRKLAPGRRAVPNGCAEGLRRGYSATSRSGLIRALVALGFLSFTRRRITPPIKPLSRAKITQRPEWGYQQPPEDTMLESILSVGDRAR